jgi:hypothetical protein
VRLSQPLLPRACLLTTLGIGAESQDETTLGGRVRSTSSCRTSSTRICAISHILRTSRSTSSKKGYEILHYTDNTSRTANQWVLSTAQHGYNSPSGSETRRTFTTSERTRRSPDAVSYDYAARMQHTSNKQQGLSPRIKNK